MQHDSHLETLIQKAFAGQQLTVRNLGFAGDEVVTRMRSENFGTPDEWLAKVKADTIFAFFGFNEAFAGYDGVEKFKADFIQAGIGQFGSGWAWLAVKGGKLEIMKTPNGENPLVHGASPLLGCDVWEHSYYIDYRNRRPDYLKAFLENLVNWEHVEEMMSKTS